MQGGGTAGFGLAITGCKAQKLRLPALLQQSQEYDQKVSEAPFESRQAPLHKPERPSPYP